jgi:tetratricopeptide (TPR) repeat protein
MTLRINRVRAWVLVIAALTIASPAAAQMTGMLQGTVKDAKGQPIEGVKITMELTEGIPTKFSTKTGKKGDYLQIGLPPGPYKVTAEKDKAAFSQIVRVGSSEPTNVNFVLRAADVGVPGGPTPEEAVKINELRKVFIEGLEAARANRLDEAVAKFSRTIEMNPSCVECYYNLATMYNAQKKFDLAVAASEKGTELATAPGKTDTRTADLIFNQGVIMWNAGKPAEAKPLFEQALKMDPNHAESHYMLGVALVSDGKTDAARTEFETYLKLEPMGLNTASAKEFLEQTRPTKK